MNIKESFKRQADVIIYLTARGWYFGQRNHRHEMVFHHRLSPGVSRTIQKIGGNWKIGIN